MPSNKNNQQPTANAGVTLSRRTLFELAGLAVASAAIPSGMALAGGPPLLGAPAAASPTDSVSPVMNTLSTYMSEAAGKPLPEEVAEKAQQHVLDTFAAMISGSELPPGRSALVFAKSYGGREVATVVASNLLCGPIEAAMVNGVMAHSDETDDSNGPSHSHPGCAVVPAALAAGERFEIGGQQFLRAVTLGYDVGSRFTIALGGQKYENESHFSTHSIATIFGAAAAAGCAASLNAHQMRVLIGYAAQQCSGLTSWRRDSEHLQKAFVFAGMTARSGVTSALVVQSGWTGVEDILSGTDNFFEAFNPKADPNVLIDKLGERYEVARTDIKKWTVGSPIQAVLDAMVILLERHHYEASQVKQVAVHLAPPEAVTVNNRDIADICVQHMTAVMLLDRTVTFHSAHDQARMRDPAILRERAKVQLVPDEALSKFLPTRAAKVEITLENGQQLSEEVDAVRGTSKNPMGHDEVIAKVRDLVTPVLGDPKCSALIDKMMKIDAVKDLRELRPSLQRT
ncbi:MAG TPA: MmgE/PrpD family protein [Candidatus Acidoferrum sp.]